MPHIYIIVSRTNTKMGWCIRKALGEQYNHVSVALDHGLSQIYSFARRKQYTPFIGGMVRESVNILTDNKKQKTQVMIYEISVSEKVYAKVVEQIGMMYEAKAKYYYNYTGALKLLVSDSSQKKKAYTCVEFATEILEGIGVRISSSEIKKTTPAKVTKLLQDYLIYEGDILGYPYLCQEEIEEEASYFQKINMLSGIWHTAAYIKGMWSSREKIGS